MTPWLAWTARSVGVLVCAALASGGCASVRYGVGERPYNPWYARTAASRSVTFRAAQTVLGQDHPAELEVSHRDFRVSAIVGESEGVRDRVIVEVHERGELSIELHTELSDDGKWFSATGVCANYDSAREQALAARILDYASAGMSQLAIADRTRAIE